jgi:hypothetical protein
MAFWTDIFTLETWAQAAARDFRVTGFPAPTSGPGGYSQRMFERVQIGDIFVCYCKTPARRWVGALLATGPAFVSDEPIWGFAADGSARFPWRFSTEPVVALEPQEGVPAEETVPQLSFLRELKTWYAYLQRSLNRIPDPDGSRLVSLLQTPRQASPITVTPALRRAPSAVPEPSLLEAQAVGAAQSDDDSPEKIESRIHTEIQAKLRDIGLAEGYDVWVADRGLEWRGSRLGDGCLLDLPVIAPERTRVAMRGIDVIWFRKGTGQPVRFFEIEHSTSVYSGLLRMNDVKIDFPVNEAFIVGETERTRAKFSREIARRTFEASELANVTKFLFYDQVRQTWLKYQAVGEGSRHWGDDVERTSERVS